MNLHYISNALCSLSSLLLLLHLFYSHLHCSAPQVLVWPKARNLTWAPPYSSIVLSPTFTISYSGSNPYLQNAVSRNLHYQACIYMFDLHHLNFIIKDENKLSGHTGSWAAAYPEIVACANMFWSKPDSFLYAGADEVIPGCWKADPKIQAFLASGGTLSQLLETHVNATRPYIESLNRTAIYWEDVLLDSTINVKPELLPKETTILQSWNNGPNNTKLITSMGYRAIVSSSAFYYLDCGHGDFLGNDSSYDKMGDEGNGIYNYDITYGLMAEEAKLVLGGEVALWSEQADGIVLDPRLRSRTAAFAEANVRYAEVIDRLDEWRYRMVARGVGAEPIQPLWCLKNPWMCNLNQ
ncbi:hypothetical protein AMTRI_Chr10g230720 [Amborella trichopoda]